MSRKRNGRRRQRRERDGLRVYHEHDPRFVGPDGRPASIRHYVTGGRRDRTQGGAK